MLKNPSLTILLSILVFLFYFSAQVLISDVYKYAVVGAVFEILSIPMLALLVILPVVTIVQLVKQKQAPKLSSIGSLLLITASILLLIYV